MTATVACAWRRPALAMEFRMLPGPSRRARCRKGTLHAHVLGRVPGAHAQVGPGSGGAESRQAFGLYAITSISTFASTISRASVVERAGLPFGKYSR